VNVREQLRRDAKPIPHSDLWISALAIQHDQPVVSMDAHFDSVSGVKRLRW
jgi:predicted nucleic acid-binding protein